MIHKNVFSKAMHAYYSTRNALMYCLHTFIPKSLQKEHLSTRTSSLTVYNLFFSSFYLSISGKETSKKKTQINAGLSYASYYNTQQKYFTNTITQPSIPVPSIRIESKWERKMWKERNSLIIIQVDMRYLSIESKRNEEKKTGLTAFFFHYFLGSMSERGSINTSMKFSLNLAQLAIQSIQCFWL